MGTFNALELEGTTQSQSQEGLVGSRVMDQLVLESGTNWSRSKGPVSPRVRDQLVQKPRTI